MPLNNLLHASFLVTLKGHKHGHVHIGDARIQRGGTGSPESPGNNKFHRKKKQFGPITLEKVGPLDIFDLPAWLLEK